MLKITILPPTSYLLPINIITGINFHLIIKPMRGGESDYLELMKLVGNELLKQSKLNGSDSFDYDFENLRVSNQDQLHCLNRYVDEKIITLKVRDEHNQISKDFAEISPETPEAWKGLMSTKVGIVLNHKKLDSFFDKLPASPVRASTNEAASTFECSLRLHDVELKLKVANEPERTIGRLQDDSLSHKLMVALMNRPAGVKVKHLEVFPDGSQPNLWHILVKNGYSYLSPFFSHSKGEISFQPKIELDKAGVISLLSRIVDKRRLPFNNLLESLKN